MILRKVMTRILTIIRRRNLRQKNFEYRNTLETSRSLIANLLQYNLKKYYGDLSFS